MTPLLFRQQVDTMGHLTLPGPSVEAIWMVSPMVVRPWHPEIRTLPIVGRAGWTIDPKDRLAISGRSRWSPDPLIAMSVGLANRVEMIAISVMLAHECECTFHKQRNGFSED